MTTEEILTAAQQIREAAHAVKLAKDKFASHDATYQTAYQIWVQEREKVIQAETALNTIRLAVYEALTREE